MDPVFNRHVEDLTRAWADRRVVAFEYLPAPYGAKREPRRATVRPYLLEPSLQTHALYLIGFDEDRGAMRTFKVERIRDLSVLLRTFEAPEDDVVAQLRRAWDIIADQPATEVVLRFRPEVAGRVMEASWHPSQRVTELAGRLAGVARDRRRHDRDPPVDPVLGQRRGGPGAGGAARGRRRDARPRGGAVRGRRLTIGPRPPGYHRSGDGRGSGPLG